MFVCAFLRFHHSHLLLCVCYFQCKKKKKQSTWVGALHDLREALSILNSHPCATAAVPINRTTSWGGDHLGYSTACTARSIRLPSCCAALDALRKDGRHYHGLEQNILSEVGRAETGYSRRTSQKKSSIFIQDTLWFLSIDLFIYLFISVAYPLPLLYERRRRRQGQGQGQRRDAACCLFAHLWSRFPGNLSSENVFQKVFFKAFPEHFFSQKTVSENFQKTFSSTMCFITLVGRKHFSKTSTKCVQIPCSENGFGKKSESFFQETCFFRKRVSGVFSGNPDLFSGNYFSRNWFSRNWGFRKCSENALQEKVRTRFRQLSETVFRKRSSRKRVFRKKRSGNLLLFRKHLIRKLVFRKRSDHFQIIISENCCRTISTNCFQIVLFGQRVSRTFFQKTGWTMFQKH